MHEDVVMGRVGWDEAKCIGCRMCTLACPFGAVVYETAKRRIVKCDLCGGNPECVAFCPTQALAYVDESEAVRMRRKAIAEELKKSFEEVK
jgi:Fe-S-cluster-containing hydrogenase component 2